MKTVQKLRMDLGAELIAVQRISDRLKSDLMSRLVVSTLLATLVWIGGQQNLALLWVLLVFSNEVLEPFLVFRLTNERIAVWWRLVPYWFHITVGTILWSSLGLVLLLSSEPATMMLGLSIIIGVLVHSTSHYTDSAITVAATSVPAAFALLAAAVLQLFTADRSFDEGVTILISILVLIGYFAFAAVSNIAAQMKLRQANHDAQAASAAKSAFLANMSHEIRTPMNGVIGMAHALQTSPLHNDQRHMVETIIQSGTSLTALLNDILDISKIEAGKVELNYQSTNIADVVTDVGQLFKPSAAKKDLTITVELEDDLPSFVLCDPLRVRQCLANLVSNAVKFTMTGGITISVRSEALIEDEGALTLSIAVTDSGIGMTEDAVGRLFEEFMQADQSTTRRFGGTGLGLAVSRKLARLMGGDLTASSVLDEGSCFTLTFKAECGAAPAARAQETAATSASPPSTNDPQSNDKTKNLLLVDDNSVNRQVIRALLRDTGLHITEATNGQEALEALAAHTFDVMILDVHMPVMDGIETIGHIRRGAAGRSDIPVIALTADAMPGDRERLLAAGMSDYMSKPVTPKALLAKLEEQLHTKLRQGNSAA